MALESEKALTATLEGRFSEDLSVLLQDQTIRLDADAAEEQPRVWHTRAISAFERPSSSAISW